MNRLYDDRRCLLGEGPLWHPERNQLFWFDILGRRMLTRLDGRQVDWSFDEFSSAAGWIDRDRLLVASETGLWVMDLTSGARDRVTALEADNPVTRSNDGRADPWGGFWIGTMGKKAEAGAGSIWRYYRGELRRLYPNISISNAISFTPDRRFACFADTAHGRSIWRVALDPSERLAERRSGTLHQPQRANDLNPDGAVFDAEGQLWIAEWGASRVACYGPDGAFRRAVAVGARHTSCPAFGGMDLATLYVTSAQLDLPDAVLVAEPANGCTFAADPGVSGLPEYQVIL